MCLHIQDAKMPTTHELSLAVAPVASVLSKWLVKALPQFANPRAHPRDSHEVGAGAPNLVDTYPRDLCLEILISKLGG